MNTEFVNTLEATEAIKALAEDLRKFALWEYAQPSDALGQETYKRNRKDSLLFAADYIEKSL